MSIKPKNNNSYWENAPNTFKQILAHPSGNNGSIELTIFNEHRFAFYYWTKWTHNLKSVPDLVTFDWHEDLGFPCAETKEMLGKLDLTYWEEIAYFAWTKLSSNNDTHILAAAYLNQIGDIWVLRKQSLHSDGEKLIDINGNEHRIHKFDTIEELYKSLLKSKLENVYLDIDIDYFTIENNCSNDDSLYTYVEEKEIEEIINPRSNLFGWLLKRTNGITIALEPQCVGGISESLRIWKIIESCWFNKSVGPMEVDWNHLK